MNNSFDTRNLILAIAVSMLILLGFNYFYPHQAPAPAQQQEAGTPPVPNAAAPNAAAPAPGAVPAVAPQAATPEQAAKNRAEALAGPRLGIKSPRLSGTIALTGARIDDLTLTDYRASADPHSPFVDLLSPAASATPYYAEFGWVAAPGQTAALPGADTRWTASGTALGPNSPVVLTWDNGQGLRFTRTIAVDDQFMFTVTQKVENASAQPVTLHAYGLINRTDKPEGYQDTYILHEGPLGVFDGTLKEVKYGELEKANAQQFDSTGGWIGYSDKYWLTALAPAAKDKVTMRMTHYPAGPRHKYQVDFMGAPVVVPAGGSVEDTTHFFAGSKQLELLDAYGDKLGIPHFDLAIDFGWFYFLTKPFFYALTWFAKHLGNFGLAILALTVVIKLALFPLANKSYVAMSKMKKLQPEIQGLQQRFGDDKMRMNQELMALYKREKVNPVSGCLPVVVQIPVFFALYKVLYGTIEMRHAPFYGWISDLSAPDPTTIFNLFGLIPFHPPSFLMIGIWPLIMGATMWLQQKLNPQPTDPVQAKMFTFLPILFTFLLASFPAGLVIYWAWSNTLSIAQQWVIMRKAGATH
jgi:YidC/Oxa1 family membrane protein insertase